jgi:hypothetical protein
MTKTASPAYAVPHTSRYRTKIRAREKGERTPFEFKEAHVSEKPPLPAAKRHYHGRLECVRATVEAVVEEKFCIFLKTGDGRYLYLTLYLFKREYPEEECVVGIILDCEVEKAKPGKYAVVRRIHSVSYPSE